MIKLITIARRLQTGAQKRTARAESNRGYSESPVKFLIIPVRTPTRLLHPEINPHVGLDEGNLADDEASEDEMKLSSLDDI